MLSENNNNFLSQSWPVSEGHTRKKSGMPLRSFSLSLVYQRDCWWYLTYGSLQDSLILCVNSLQLCLNCLKKENWTKSLGIVDLWLTWQLHLKSSSFLSGPKWDLNTALQKLGSRCSIRSAAAWPPILSPGESSPAYQFSEGEQLQCVLSCLNVDAASKRDILTVRRENPGIFRTWFLRSS